MNEAQIKKDLLDAALHALRVTGSRTAAAAAWNGATPDRMVDAAVLEGSNIIREGRVFDIICQSMESFRYEVDRELREDPRNVNIVYVGTADSTRHDQLRSISRLPEVLSCLKEVRYDDGQ